MKEAIQIAANTNYYGLTNKADYHGKLKNKNCGDEIKIEFDIKKIVFLILDMKVKCVYIVKLQHLLLQIQK
jgi:NifU-like protein involved in Fe-S cluster formation